MDVTVTVKITPATIRDAIMLLEAIITYLEWAIQDADTVLSEAKIDPANVDTGAKTATSRVAAFLSIEHLIEDIRELVEEVHRNSNNSYPSPDDFDEVDKENE